MPGNRAIAQTPYLPPTWSQWQQYLPMMNPAANGMTDDAEVILSNQRFLGLWRNNEGYFANANLRLKNKKRETAFHVLGAQLVTDKEGEYLQRTKMYAQYAYHLQVRKNLWLAAGTALGAMSYSVGNNDFSSGGASTAPDGSVGIYAYGSNYRIGISGSQLLQSTLQPIREKIYLIRYFTFTAEKTFELTPSFTIKPSALMRWPPGYNTFLSLGLHACISEWVLAGINVGINREVAFIFGLTGIEWGSTKLKGTFAYRIPAGMYSVSNQQSFEIMLGVSFIKKKKKEIENQEDE